MMSSIKTMNTTPRVLFYLPDLRGGGAERVLLHIIRYFKDSGVDVYIALNQITGDLVEDAKDLGKIHSLHSKGVVGAVPAFIRLVKELKITHVIASLNATIVAALAAPFLPRSVKVISRLGNTIGAERHKFSGIKSWAYIRLHKFIYSRVYMVVCQSDYMLNDYLEHIGIDNRDQKVIRIYNPVRTDRPVVDHDARDHAFQLVSMGRLVLQKDHATLIRAMKQVVQKLPQIRLAILGEGPERDNLEKLIASLSLQDHVSLPGFVSRSFEYVSRAKIFVLSSIYEGFSNAIIEALAAGTPVVVTECPGGNAEVVKDGFNGYLVPVGDDASLAGAIIKVLQQYNQFDQDAIQQDTRARFGLEKIGKDYRALVVPDK